MFIIILSHVNTRYLKVYHYATTVIVLVCVVYCHAVVHVPGTLVHHAGLKPPCHSWTEQMSI